MARLVAASPRLRNNRLRTTVPPTCSAMRCMRIAVLLARVIRSPGKDQLAHKYMLQLAGIYNVPRWWQLILLLRMIEPTDKNRY
jgi:hypothetical protein